MHMHPEQLINDNLSLVTDFGRDGIPVSERLEKSQCAAIIILLLSAICLMTLSTQIFFTLPITGIYSKMLLNIYVLHH